MKPLGTFDSGCSLPEVLALFIKPVLFVALCFIYPNRVQMLAPVKTS